jgi:hypothetical protein
MSIRKYWVPDTHGTAGPNRLMAVARSNGDIAIWNLKEVERILAKLGLDAGEPPVPREPAQRR